MAKTELRWILRQRNSSMEELKEWLKHVSSYSDELKYSSMEELKEWLKRFFDKIRFLGDSSMEELKEWLKHKTKST